MTKTKYAIIKCKCRSLHVFLLLAILLIPAVILGYSLVDFEGTYRGAVTTKYRDDPTKNLTTVVRCDKSKAIDIKGRPLLECKFAPGEIMHFAFDNGTLDANMEIGRDNRIRVCKGTVNNDGKNMTANQTCYWETTTMIYTLDIEKL